MELDLPPMFWKCMLREQVGLHELSQVDARTAAVLQAVADSTNQETWAILQEERSIRWRVQHIDGRVMSLRGDGTLPVAFEERREYVHSAVDSWMKQFQVQISAVRTGFYAVFPEVTTRLLTWRELERRVCGCPDVRVAELQRIAEVSGGAGNREYIKSFWTVLRGFTGDQRKQFLGFVWGRSRLPARSTERFKIDISGNVDSLPRSHTCMFELHLPRYPSVEVLRQRLLLAVQNAGARSSGGGPARLAAMAMGGDELCEAAPASRPTRYIDCCSDRGHIEDLESFMARCGLLEAEAECWRDRLKEHPLLRVDSMSALLASSAATLEGALTAVLSGEEESKQAAQTPAATTSATPESMSTSLFYTPTHAFVKIRRGPQPEAEEVRGLRAPMCGWR
jgi:hypothetical protein